MAHIQRINYREVHIFMYTISPSRTYLIKYAHMAHIKRINYREVIYWLYNKEKPSGANGKGLEKRSFYSN